MKTINDEQAFSWVASNAANTDHFWSLHNRLKLATTVSLLGLGCGGNVGDQSPASAFNATGGQSAIGSGGTSSFGSGGTSPASSPLDAATPSRGVCQGLPIDVSSGATIDCVGISLEFEPPNVHCTLTLPQPPAGQALDISKAQVVYLPPVGGAQEIPIVGSPAYCSGPNGGWFVDNPAAPAYLTLCPCTCANINGGAVDINFPCRTGPTII
jgi:hypothetical protein